MGTQIELTSSDGHRAAAYVAEPAAEPRGGIVVVQEIFGVTRHIRAVADQYAAAGYLAIAPALFDRVEPGVEVEYTDIQKARGYAQAVSINAAMLDVGAALGRAAVVGKVGVVGYCWGGLLSFLAAARLKVDAAVAYYGGGIEKFVAERPSNPMMFHFGEADSHIPPTTVAEIKAAYPQGIYHSYPAGHGFNCTDRMSYDAASATLALARSVEFFRQHIG